MSDTGGGCAYRYAQGMGSKGYFWHSRRRHQWNHGIDAHAAGKIFDLCRCATRRQRRSWPAPTQNIRADWECVTRARTTAADENRNDNPRGQSPRAGVVGSGQFPMAHGPSLTWSIRVRYSTAGLKPELSPIGRKMVGPIWSSLNLRERVFP
jgi:hypothetical protein